MALTHLCIGIETELLLRLHDTKEAAEYKGNVQTFAPRITQAYASHLKHPDQRLLVANFFNGASPGHYIEADYDGGRNWRVARDSTVRVMGEEAEPKHYWVPVEIVSPIFEYKVESTWRDEVTAHWNTLATFASIKVNATCATHIHISPPKGQSWHLSNLKRLAKRAMFFEGAFDSLVPSERKGNIWCKNNKSESVRYKMLSDSEMFDLIDACGTVLELVRLIQPAGKFESEPKGGKGSGVSRCYSWNFCQCVRDGGLGTVEWRKAPGSTSEAECLKWVELGVDFVWAAMCVPEEEKFGNDVAGLRAFLRRGMMEEMGGCGGVGEGVAGRVVGEEILKVDGKGKGRAVARDV